MTDLQNKIIEYMKSISTFNNPKWGFSCIGHRELAREFGISSVSASNSMRCLFDKGFFFKKEAKDRHSEMIYYLRNDGKV